MAETKLNSKTNSASSWTKLFYFSRSIIREIKHRNVSAVSRESIRNTCMTETTFHSCFSFFVLVFYFKCVTVEIKHCFTSVFSAVRASLVPIISYTLYSFVYYFSFIGFFLGFLGWLHVRYFAGNIKYFGTNQVEGNHRSVNFLNIVRHNDRILTMQFKIWHEKWQLKGTVSSFFAFWKVYRRHITKPN